MSDPADRPFTEAETNAIIARAARAQHALPTTAEAGLTLAELQEIGQAAGLSPAHVAAAAAALRAEQAGGAAGGRLGLPGTIRAVRVIAVPVSDAAWERMVTELRRHFATAGHAGNVGRLREWTATQPSATSTLRHELHAVLAPHDLGAVLTLEQRRADRHAREYVAVGGVLGSVGLVLTGITLAVAAAPAALALVGGGLLATGAALGGGGLAAGRAWARRRQASFDELLDRLELVARTTG